MADLRKPCSAVRDNGWACDYVEHPGMVHVTWVNGWPQQWSSAPGSWDNVKLSGPEILETAPQALVSGPLAEGVSVQTGRVIYGEMVPGTGSRLRQISDILVYVVPDSITIVEVPGHRGGCEGDCTREGMRGAGWIPECWPPELAQGIGNEAAKWKDWVNP